MIGAAAAMSDYFFPSIEDARQLSGAQSIDENLAWAHGLADPYIAAAREWTARMRAMILQEEGGRFWRMVRAIRERVRRTRQA